MDEISALESLLRIEAQKSSAFATIIMTMLGLERHGTPCMRCALRFAGVWDGQIYRVSGTATQLFRPRLLFPDIVMNV